eukprot:scaffold1208_cov231-Pinguiococcus_pyrenoidosus.AAC.6
MRNFELSLDSHESSALTYPPRLGTFDAGIHLAQHACGWPGSLVAWRGGGGSCGVLGFRVRRQRVLARLNFGGFMRRNNQGARVVRRTVSLCGTRGTCGQEETCGAAAQGQRSERGV